MSFGGVTVADGGPKMYFCHQCDHTVTISPSPLGDILCPTCNSGFVEEFQNPNPTIPEPFIPDPFALLFSQFFLPPHNTSNPLSTPQSNPTHERRLEPDVFDPILYLTDLLTNRRANGIDYQFIFGDGAQGHGIPNMANMGDYFMGPGFEELIQHLAENDPNRHGTPPAAKSAVEALPSINVDEELMKSELAQCAVCKDDFELGTAVKQMPCKHVYHDDCILPWLDLHNSCPVCRFELPTDDPDYENMDRNSSSRTGVSAGNSTTGNVNNEQDGSVGGSEGQRVVERRFTISIPWLFGRPGSSGGGSQQQN